jgi:hypothetical protein
VDRVDKELRPAGVRLARVRHGQGARLVRHLQSNVGTWSSETKAELRVHVRWGFAHIKASEAICS